VGIDTLARELGRSDGSLPSAGCHQESCPRTACGRRRLPQSRGHETPSGSRRASPTKLTSRAGRTAPFISPLADINAGNVAKLGFAWD